MAETEEYLRDLVGYLRSQIQEDSLRHEDIIMLYRELVKTEYKVADYSLSLGDEIADIIDKVEAERPDLFLDQEEIDGLLVSKD